MCTTLTIFTYVKQALTLFEVLLYMLPHFTTDTLSHSSWRLSIWSCNMNTCIQTQEHLRKYKVMFKLDLIRMHWSDVFLKRGLSQKSEALLCYQVHCVWNCSRSQRKKRGKALFLLPAAVSISFFMCSYFLFWLTIRLSFTLSLSFNQPAFFRHSLWSLWTFDHTLFFPSVSICLGYSLIFFYQIPYGGDSGNTRCFCLWGWHCNLCR